MDSSTFRIAYFCSSLSWGGLEMNHLKNAIKMRERGHYVVVVGDKKSPFIDTARKNNLPILCIKKHHKYFHFFAAFKLAYLLKNESINRILIRDNRDIGISAFTRRCFYKKLRVFYFMEMQLTIDKKNFFQRRRFQQIEKWSCSLPYMKNQVIKHTLYPESNIVIIPSGIDLEKYQNLPSKLESRSLFNINPSTYVFGIIGRLDPQKGHEIVIRAFSEIHTEKEDCILLFMGNPTEGEHAQFRQRLEKLITDFQIESKVFFYPFSDEVLSFYSACDTIIMGSFAETFGMVTLEALAAGKQVIGSDTAGTPDLLESGKYGDLFESQNANDLIGKMRSAFTGKRKIPTHNDLIKYSFKNVLNQIEKILE